MKEYYVSIKGSLGFTIFAENMIHQKCYYSLINDVFVCFQINENTICRIPQRIIQEIKLCYIFRDSEIIYQSK